MRGSEAPVSPLLDPLPRWRSISAQVLGRDVIIQEHIAGLEFGVFYFRYPQSERGESFRLPGNYSLQSTGDGESTVKT